MTIHREDTAEAFWDRERRFWLEGETFVAANVHAAGVMVFAPPAGIISGGDISVSLRGAARWTRLEMEETSVYRPSPDVTVLAYRALAHRGASAPYAAHCSSGYLRTGAGWKLFLHQQTPAGPAYANAAG